MERPVPVDLKPAMNFSLFYFPTKQKNSSSGNIYKLLVEGAKFADQNGFEAIWVPERHFHNFGDQFPNPSVAAAAVSTITNKVALRSGSVVLPLHDPVRVAEEWSMIDNLSEGRVELSIASGWHPNDFVLAPNPEDFKNRHQVMRGKIGILKDLWSGKSLKRKNGLGEDFEFRIHPRPIQEDLPIWITAGGSIQTFEYAGTIGANILTHLLGQSIEDLTEKIQAYRKALLENGFDPEKGKVALMLHTFVAKDPQFVKSVVEEPFKAYLSNSFNLLKPIAEEQGLDVNNHLDTVLDLGFQRFYKMNSLFGTPESRLELIGTLHQIGVNEIACLIDFGVEEDLVLDHLQHLDSLKELVRRSRYQYEYIMGRMANIKEEETTVPLIKQYGISHIQSTPSFYEELLLSEDGRQALKDIDTLLVGGEALKKSLAQKLLELRGRPIYNMYGPTETTIWSAIKKVEDSEEITIGKPIANTQIYILDPQDKLCSTEVPGELWIAGDGVSLGYLHQPELTQARFAPNPFRAGERMYKTGDMARWLPNGELEFLGRVDRQVKIKGYRIELGEIESVIAAIPQVIQSVVSKYTSKGQEMLVAFLKVAEALEAGQVRAFLSLRLPQYMVPKEIVFLEEFPYTPNGKIDVKKLPHPDSGLTHTSRKYLAPSTPLEQDLARIWEEALHLEKVSIDDNFFEIGGNSMKAFQLLAVINKELNLDLTIISFFQYPTIQQLAESLDLEPVAVELEQDDMENVDDLMDFMENM